MMAIQLQMIYVLMQAHVNQHAIAQAVTLSAHLPQIVMTAILKPLMFVRVQEGAQLHVKI